MLDRVGSHNIGDHLTALADGELDAAQVLAVLEYLESDPAALAGMRREQRVRVAVERAVRASTPPVPEALRRAVEAAAAAPKADPPRRPRGLLPLVAAATLVTGLLAGRLIAPRPTTAPPPPPAVAAAEPHVPARLVAFASRVHADCSRLAWGLHAAGYPQELTGLAAAVRADLAAADAHPDLSAIGYRFAGAGPCGEPLGGTVHLLYHKVGTGPRRTLSVFVQAWADQFPLVPGKHYLLSGPLSPFPVYAWRTAAVIYFLVADDDDSSARAGDDPNRPVLTPDASARDAPPRPAEQKGVDRPRNRDGRADIRSHLRTLDAPITGEATSAF